MATRALIGRLTGWSGPYPVGEGVYHHWDGYPTGLGALLFNLFRGEYKGNLEEMLKEIVDKHLGGWSDLAAGDCYCHPDEETADGFGDLQWASHLGCEWAYLFAVQDGRPMMVVARLLTELDNRGEMISREWWEAIATVPLDGEEPDWKAIETAGYERYATVHGGIVAVEASENRVGSSGEESESEKPSTARNQVAHRGRGGRGQPGQRGKANRGTARYRS